MFQDPVTRVVLKREFKEHFRNISRIMDCVGCEKCRLWGKVQVSGVATALKILFSFADESFTGTSNLSILRRDELVALFNTFGRLSESLLAVENFRQLYQARVRNQQQGPIESWTTNVQTVAKNLLDGMQEKMYTFSCHVANQLEQYHLKLPDHLDPRKR
jgi:hypothetical protein